tara:strand:+ start:920 stop:1327 length:408 start_codon:yes stop_codon:yes gene_type:complete
MGININLLSIVIGLIIGGLLSCHLFCGCINIYKTDVKEGLEGAPLDYHLGEGVINDTWSTPPVDAVKAQQGMYASLANNKAAPVQTKGLFIFSKNLFKPECCYTPQQYSSSTGCACISTEQMKFISGRGGNNTLP